jgi:hypothetical protein
VPDGSLSECAEMLSVKFKGLVIKRLPPRVPLEQRLKPSNEEWELVRRKHNEPHTQIWDHSDFSSKFILTEAACR